jgi:N-acetylneuraminic acid mutarotase
MRLKLWHTLTITLFIISLSSAAFAAHFPQEDTDEILVIGDATASACSGLTHTYYLEVVNATAQEETVNLSADGNTWQTAIEPTALLLPAGESEFVAVTVLVPLTALPGDTDSAVITGEGQISGLSGSAVLTTRAALAQGWEDSANSPEGRGTRDHALVYWDGKLYKIGGFGYLNNVGGDRPWLDIYDIAADSWSQGADMISGRSLLDCEAIDLSGSDPKIYCAGGYRSSARSNLYIYDINTDTWSTGPDLPEPRFGYASISHEDKYYVIGGVNTTATSTVYIYNPTSATWDSSKAPMTVARSYFSAGLINGKILAAGGYDTIALSSVETYDIAANQWSPAATLPTTWVNAAEGIIDDRFLLMVGGGENGISAASNRGYLYDSQQDSWSLLPLFNHSIYGSEGAGEGNDFWVVSGRIYEDSSFSNSTYNTHMVRCGSTCVPVSGVDFTWEPPLPIEDELVTFTASVAEGSPPFTYLWDFGDGTYGNTKVIDHAYDTSGTYTVDLAVSNCYGSVTAFASHELSVTGTPIISANPTSLESTLKAGSTEDLQLEICNLGQSSLTWDIEEAQQTAASAPTSILREITDLPWVTPSPISGTLDAGECGYVTVSFTAASLEVGDYFGLLKVNSNDPTTPILDIPLHLIVEDQVDKFDIYLPLIIR